MQIRPFLPQGALIAGVVFATSTPTPLPRATPTASPTPRPIVATRTPVPPTRTPVPPSRTPTPAVRAPIAPHSAWATHHINYLYLTPLAVAATRRAVGLGGRPRAGQQFVLVTFREVNSDDVEQQVPRADLTLVTSSGATIRPGGAVLPADVTQAMLPSGAALTGQVMWEVPAALHRATVRWRPTPPSAFSPQVRWPSYTWKISF